MDGGLKALQGVELGDKGKCLLSFSEEDVALGGFLSFLDGFGIRIRDVPVRCNNANILVVEPNVKEHNVFKLTDYKEAYDKADIVVFLTAHTPFKELPWKDDKVILDFCGIFKQ